MNPYKLSDEEDPQLLNSLTPGTSQQPSPVPLQPPPPAAAVPALTQAPGPQAAPPSAPPAAPMGRLPGMPPSVTPADLENYLGTQKAALTKYGPDAQMALQQSLNDRRNSLGYKATEGLKGFGDAIMSGVARAGNPDWQGQFQGQENALAQEKMNTLRGADEAQGRNVQSGMMIDKIDPKSTMSKAAQQNYAPLFRDLGYPADKLNGMSAANIESALSLMAAYGGKKIEAQIKQYELRMEQMRLGASIQNQQQEREMQKENNQRQATEDLSKIPWYSRVLHPGISDALRDQAGLNEQEFTPDVKAYAQKHGITPQEALHVKKERGG